MTENTEEKNETLPVAANNGMVVVNGKEIPLEVKEDFDTARNNIIELLREGNASMVNLTEIAKDTEHPRVYEVLSGMMTTLSNLNKQLIELNKQKMDMLDNFNDAKEQPKTGGDTNITNAVFVGSTKDLQEYYKSMKNKEK